MLLEKVPWCTHDGQCWHARGWGDVSRERQPAQPLQPAAAGSGLPAALPVVPAGGIYTVHVQQSGRRFATGGADSLVKVWSLAPVLDAAREKAGPLVLATLSDHSSTVNTVRFSKNGKFLASGGCAGMRGKQGGGPLAGRRLVPPGSPTKRNSRGPGQHGIQTAALAPALAPAPTWPSHTPCHPPGRL